MDDDSRVSLFLYEPKSVIRLDENSIFSINPVTDASYNRTSPKKGSGAEFASIQSTFNYCVETINRTWFDLKQGALHLFTTEPQQLNINTPYMNASIEGTEFVVRVDSDSTQVAVVDGVVGVCNENGYQSLTKGQRAESEKGAAPQIITPENAVQWALYYPLVGEKESVPDQLLKAYELVNSGQIDEALDLLGDDNNAYDLALRSSITVVQNDIGKAMDLANQAVDLDPDSSSALIALSYAQQAQFDLKEAQASVEQASNIDQGSALILARLAELQLSNGDKKSALKNATNAVAANPKISRAHTVLGFVQLSQFDIDQAQESFGKAINQDDDDPLPRLGLGLINVRKNNLPQGKKNMEIAVSLGPGSSILRS